MARRRTRIKDINVFKQTKATEEPTNSSEQTDEKGKIMAEDRTEADNVDTSVSLNESDVDDFAGLAAEAELAAGQPPSDLAGASEDLPTNESDFDLAASLGAEAAAATPDDDNLGLPPALETPPDDIGLDLPTGESDLADIEPGSADFDDLVESDLGLPVAMDQPAADIDFGFPPAMETPAAGPADFNFESAFDPPPQPTTAQPDLPDFPPAMMTDLPPAMDTPPADIPASPSLADLPIGEAGFGDMANLPVGEAGFDSSTDFPSGEAGLDMPAETLPSGEAGLGTSAPYSLPNETYNTMPGSGTTSPYESSAPIPVDMPVDSSPRPVPPPETSSSLPVPPQTGGTLAVSNTIPLTLDDDSPRDIFDFMGVTNEPQTITYQIPEDIEELTVEERKRRMLLLKDNRVREQFDKIYHAVDSEYEHLLDSNISSNKEITDWAQNLLAETRYILMNYQIEHLAKAEWNIQQVRARLDRAEESERWRQKWGWLIIIWGVVWFFIFVILIFNPTPLLFLLYSTNSLDYLVPDVFLRTLFFGGIGGVTSVFYSLLQYVSSRRYDKEYNFSYFTKPFMGMIVGTLVYLMLYVVAPIFGVNPQTGTGTVADENVFEVLSFFFAIAAGFKENVAFSLLSRLMKMIFREEPPKEEKEGEPPPPPGPFNYA